MDGRSVVHRVTVSVAARTAPAGHTSMHSKQSVHRSLITAGRSGEGASAFSGQVIMQAPQAVHAGVIATVTERPRTLAA